MKTAEQLYEEMKGLPVEEQNRRIKEYGQYLQTLPEEERNRFYESFMKSLDKLKEESKQLSLNVEKALLQKGLVD